MLHTNIRDSTVICVHSEVWQRKESGAKNFDADAAITSPASDSGRCSARTEMPPIRLLASRHPIPGRERIA
jgi:hypothetical protein